MHDHPAPKWLADVGWRVHDFIRRPEAMQRFREMLEAWRLERERQNRAQQEWRSRRETHFRSHLRWSVEFAEHRQWFDEAAGSPGDDHQFEAHRYTIRTTAGDSCGTEPIWCWFPPALCWSAEPQVHSPLSFTQRSKRSGPNSESRRALTLPERYALITVIHDAICSGVARVDPSETDPSVDPASFEKHVPYLDLLSEISKLEIDDQPAVEAFLADVIDDLNVTPAGKGPEGEELWVPAEEVKRLYDAKAPWLTKQAKKRADIRREATQADRQRWGNQKLTWVYNKRIVFELKEAEGNSEGV